jgi:hypothetical protein
MSTPITLVMTLAFRYPTPILFTFNCDRNILNQADVKFLMYAVS